MVEPGNDLFAVGFDSHSHSILLIRLNWRQLCFLQEFIFGFQSASSLAQFR